jgi:hypothetical protein
MENEVPHASKGIAEGGQPRKRVYYPADLLAYLVFMIARPWLLLLPAVLFLASCDSRPYQRGYEDGYSKGYADGHDVGYRQGYEHGYSQARPGGSELSSSEAGWVNFGALLGGFGLLGGLAYAALALVVADISPEVAKAKAGAIAVAILLSAIMVLMGAHRIADPLLLAGRPGSRLLTGIIVLLAAVPTVVAAAWLRSLRKDIWSARQQTVLAAAFSFTIFFVFASVVAMMKAPEGERYLFPYIGIGILLGMVSHVAFRLMRRAEGW